MDYYSCARASTDASTVYAAGGLSDANKFPSSINSPNSTPSGEISRSDGGGNGRPRDESPDIPELSSSIPVVVGQTGLPVLIDM
jgi:hypothetical protein